MEEIWKDIPGYEGLYQASNLGNIKSLWFYSNMQKKRYKREKILKQKKDKYNSYRVELWNNKEHKTWLVHRLIGITFLGIPEENMTINHKDGNRLNNKVNNLEWLSLADNIRHAFRTNLMSYQKHTYVIDKKTMILKNFNSMSKASEYINHNSGYISGEIIKGRTENDKYIWGVY